jgi:hypothetical protein
MGGHCQKHIAIADETKEINNFLTRHLRINQFWQHLVHGLAKIGVLASLLKIEAMLYVRPPLVSSKDFHEYIRCPPQNWFFFLFFFWFFYNVFKRGIYDIYYCFLNFVFAKWKKNLPQKKSWAPTWHLIWHCKDIIESLLHKKIFVVTPIAPLKGEAEPTKKFEPCHWVAHSKFWFKNLHYN